jgi:hypothetical protein
VRAGIEPPRVEPAPTDDLTASVPPTASSRYRVDLLFVRIRALQGLFRPERRHEETVIVAIAPITPFR